MAHKIQVFVLLLLSYLVFIALGWQLREMYEEVKTQKRG